MNFLMTVTSGDDWKHVLGVVGVRQREISYWLAVGTMHNHGCVRARRDWDLTGWERSVVVVA